jgi:hypothetical protein
MRRPTLSTHATAPFTPPPSGTLPWNKRPSVLQARAEREAAAVDPAFGDWLGHVRAGRIGTAANAAAPEAAAPAPQAPAPDAAPPHRIFTLRDGPWSAPR